MAAWSPAAVVTVIAVVGVLVITLVVVSILLMRGIIGAGQSPAPSMLVVSISLLSLTAMIGGLVFDSDSALALSGAGIGALAGAVSSVFTGSDRTVWKKPPKNDGADGGDLDPLPD